MISFRFNAELVTVGPGQQWSSPVGPETYRDTTADELRQIVTETEAGEAWRDCVARHYRQRHHWLHRIVTDESRHRFFRQYPLPPDSRVLDVGAGWGQIALPLARGHRVTALEPTPERLAFIAAAARQEGVADRMTFLQADFFALDFESQFDAICCIGVLEWVPKFRPGLPRELQREFLARMRAALAPGGRVIVGIENRLGLKYLLGSPDDHIGLPGIAVLDQELAIERYRAETGRELRSFTYSLAEYRELFAEAGFPRLMAYAAFPDYKIPELIAPVTPALEQTIRSTDLPREHNGSNGALLEPTQQATLVSHYRSLATLGIAGQFAPSFFLTAETTGD
jgi:2-polyprenyl-3-methyl-5-hydroxy-6-metoxy-1,4-benzoquinol methylase